MKEPCQSARAARAFMYLLDSTSGEDFECLLSRGDAVRAILWLQGLRESLPKSFQLSHVPYFHGQGGPLTCTEDICHEELWMMSFNKYKSEQCAESKPWHIGL